MATRLSHSSVVVYNQCARKYKLQYIDRLRSKTLSSALLFGSALDAGLNHLLETNDLDKSISIFEGLFTNNKINSVPQYMPDNVNMVYIKGDFDKDLLTEDDYIKYQLLKDNMGLDSSSKPQEDVAYLQGIKEEQGLKALSEEERCMFNLANWLSMRRKGVVMLKSYQRVIMPQINKVLAIQKPISLRNDHGDEVIGTLDLAVEWKDGKHYLLDNKTATKEYTKNAAMSSQQLILYHHVEKEELNLDGVGFIVLYKQIIKNRIKICKSCGKDGSGHRHKTCDNMIDTKRCNGEWDETIDPEARIKVILNQIPEAAENLVIECFDEANEGIKRKVFNPNLNACGSLESEWQCPYLQKCWQGSDEELVKV